MVVLRQKGHISVLILTDNVPRHFNIYEAP